MSGASQTRANLTLLAIVALWGSFPATAKLALADFPPFFLAAVRCTLASCFLFVLLARSSSDTIRGRRRASRARMEPSRRGTAHACRVVPGTPVRPRPRPGGAASRAS